MMIVLVFAALAQTADLSADAQTLEDLVAVLEHLDAADRAASLLLADAPPPLPEPPPVPPVVIPAAAVVPPRQTTAAAVPH